MATLLESAPLDTTPKAATFHAADKAAAPILAVLGEHDRAKAELTFDTILSSVAANTERQLLAFGSQIAANLTKQMTLIVEPISKRLAAIEGGYDSGARADDEDANKPARDLAWGRGQELVPSSDPHEVEMLDDYTAFTDIPGTDPNYKRADPDDNMIPPFLDRIYRRVHQVPDNIPITHRKHVDELHEMKRWFDFFYLPHTSHDVEIDRKAESLPQLIEQDIAREYREWYETGETVPTAPRPVPTARTPRPPAPSSGKPHDGSTALAYATAAGTGRDNVKVAGPSARTSAGLNPPVRQPSQPAITSLQEFPPMVSDWSMPEGHQSGDGFDPAKNPIYVDSSSEDVGGGWFTTPPRGRRQRQAAAKRQQSFAAAAAANPAPKTPATSELTKEDLDKLPKPDVIRTYNQRFNGNMAANTKLSKEAIIASYLAKINAPTPPPKAPPRANPTPTTTQYTIVRNPTTAGLTKVTSRTHDAPAVVRSLQRALRQQFPTGTKVPVDLIGGRWGAQSSSNFVLIFNGSPGNVAVMQCRQVFHDFFGADCTIVPQQGYSRVLLRLVPLCRSESGSLPPPDALLGELRRNFLFRDLTMFCAPRWLKADPPETAVHGSVVVTFLDEDGSLTKTIIRSPVFMFGGSARACKFNSLPLLAQCERCWRLGHATRRCPKPKTLVVCSICGGAHKAADHQFKCRDVKKHSTLKCDCPRSCLNCKRESPTTADGHLSTDHTCPLRAKYRAPLTRTGDSTDEEVHASIPMLVEDPLTFSDEPHTTATLEPARNV